MFYPAVFVNVSLVSSFRFNIKRFKNLIQSRFNSESNLGLLNAIYAYSSSQQSFQTYCDDVDKFMESFQQGCNQISNNETYKEIVTAEYRNVVSELANHFSHFDPNMNNSNTILQDLNYYKVFQKLHRLFQHR